MQIAHGQSLAAFLVLALAALLGLAVLLWWKQERIVFQPPPYDGARGRMAERVDYTAADGQPLYGLLAGDPRTAPGTIVAFHGNADLAVRQLPWARQVHRRTGFAVLLAEYRGYGGLPGVPSYAGARLDAQAAWQTATERLGSDPARTVLFGHSLGSAIAAELATEVRPAALLLEAPFTSTRAMASRMGAWAALPFWNRLARLRWDTERRVADLDMSVAVAHGTRDMIIPVRMGRSVHAAAAVQGPLLLVEGAGHNDVAAVSGERYWEWLASSLEGVGAEGR
jgi:uncharacterized protein